MSTPSNAELLRLNAGDVYQFNQARALVVEITDDVIGWYEKSANPRRHKPQTIRSTPRWFFEKHAREIGNV